MMADQQDGDRPDQREPDAEPHDAPQRFPPVLPRLIRRGRGEGVQGAEAEKFGLSSGGITLWLQAGSMTCRHKDGQS